jgi:hypothetical protein
VSGCAAVYSLSVQAKAVALSARDIELDVLLGITYDLGVG